MTEIETAVGSAVKVTCSRDELTRALSVVGRAVSTRAAVQVLGGVLLRATDGRLELAATDMEVSLRLSAEAQMALPKPRMRSLRSVVVLSCLQCWTARTSC